MLKGLYVVKAQNPVQFVENFSVISETADKTHPGKKKFIWTPQDINYIFQSKKLIQFKGSQRPFEPLWTNCL